MSLAATDFDALGHIPDAGFQKGVEVRHGGNVMRGQGMLKFWPSLFFLFFLLFPSMPTRAAAQDGKSVVFVSKPQLQFYFLDGFGQKWAFMDNFPHLMTGTRIRSSGTYSSIPKLTGYDLPSVAIPQKDALWALGWDEKEGVDRMMLLKFALDEDVTEWEPVAEIDRGNGMADFMIPIETEGLFLGVTQFPFTCFVDENFVASQVAVFNLKGGTLEFLRCIPLGFDSIENIVDVSHRPPPTVKPEELDQWNEVKHQMANRMLRSSASGALEPNLWPPGIYGKYMAFYGPSVGCIWVIDLEKGALHHTFYLDKVSADDLDALGVLAGLGAGRVIDPLILGAAFAPDGKLIVAKRHPELVKMALKLAKDPERANDRRKLWEDLQFFLESYHKVVWLSIDLESKSVEDITAYLPPDTQPPAKRSLAWLQFVVMPSGKIVTNFQSSNWDEWEKTLQGLERAPQEETDKTEADHTPKEGAVKEGTAKEVSSESGTA